MASRIAPNKRLQRPKASAAAPPVMILVLRMLYLPALRNRVL